MAVDATPSDTDLVTEAYDKFGITSPSSTQIARAIQFGLGQVKDKIMAHSIRWQPLAKTDYPVLQANIPYIAMPTDFSADMKVSIVDGFHRSTLAAYNSATPSVTLNSSDNPVAVEVQGKLIFIVGGTGVAQARTCTLYDASTRIATLDSAYTTPVDTTSQYLVESIRIPLGAPKPGWDYDELIYPTTVMRPWASYLIPDDNQGKLQFYPVPDKLYGVIRRYYSNLRRIDTSTVPYTKVQMDWRDLFIQGVFMWICNDQDDSRRDSSISDFAALVKIQGGKDIAGYNSQNLQRTLEGELGTDGY